MNSNIFDKILYHGSRHGIQGKIQPISNSTSDFGSGFYMGTDLIQAIERASTSKDGIVYALKVDYSEDKYNSIFLEDNQWLLTVLAYREFDNKIDNSLYYNIKHMLLKYDFIVGRIADDDFAGSFKNFTDNSITDKCLLKLLTSSDIGTQFVAKTQKACNSIEIIDKISINDELSIFAKSVKAASRKSMLQKCDKIKNEYYNKGITQIDLYKKIKNNKLSLSDVFGIIKKQHKIRNI